MMLFYFIVFSIVGLCIRIFLQRRFGFLTIILISIAWGLSFELIWGLVSMGEMLLGFLVADIIKNKKYKTIELPREKSQSEEFQEWLCGAKSTANKGKPYTQDNSYESDVRAISRTYNKGDEYHIYHNYSLQDCESLFKKLKLDKEEEIIRQNGSAGKRRGDYISGFKTYIRFLKEKKPN